MILDILSFSCPLILASIGALFSEYAGILALFLDGFITFSGFQLFLFVSLTGNFALGMILACLITTFYGLLFSFLVEKSKANQFIAAIGINLFFSAFVSFLSFCFFKNRGVLTNPSFYFSPIFVKIFSIILSIILVASAIYFLYFTQKGIYFRITGTNADVLEVKGIHPGNYRIAAWTIATFYAFFAGALLTLRVSSFVPNLSAGKGWMALAAVFLGRKKIWKICLFVIIFCGADYLSTILPNFIQNIPSSVLLALPYLTILLITALDKQK
ncbi:MAG: ABC transporter permease [Treponema sp.]|nr:ABC transporter permease [Treponema sp.]